MKFADTRKRMRADPIHLDKGTKNNEGNNAGESNEGNSARNEGQRYRFLGNA